MPCDLLKTLWPSVRLHKYCIIYNRSQGLNNGYLMPPLSTLGTPRCHRKNARTCIDLYVWHANSKLNEFKTLTKDVWYSAFLPIKLIQWFTLTNFPCHVVRAEIYCSNIAYFPLGILTQIFSEPSGDSQTHTCRAIGDFQTHIPAVQFSLVSMYALCVHHTLSVRQWHQT